MSEFTTMSEFSDDLPTTIDTTAEIDWPDETPDVPEFQKEVSEIAEENKSVLETVDWTQILDEQDQRRVAITIEHRQARLGYLYSHLTNPEINWELNRKTKRIAFPVFDQSPSIILAPYFPDGNALRFSYRTNEIRKPKTRNVSRFHRLTLVKFYW
ncbi:hypothetical protein DER44DRAFT_834980 [Fusarium oxysporum]|nr:hypothetical protein DER44DRAFT_834980 [Fusarium oxysporum]